jgi:hypothetical protein
MACDFPTLNCGHPHSLGVVEEQAKRFFGPFPFFYCFQTFAWLFAYFSSEKYVLIAKLSILLVFTSYIQKPKILLVTVFQSAPFSFDLDEIVQGLHQPAFLFLLHYHPSDYQ